MALSNPIKERFESLPLILCGPILRRVDSQIASVWVALKEPRRIKLRLYIGYTESDVNKTPDFESGFFDTLAVGDHLHITVVQVQTKGFLKNGEIYSYDLLFHEPGTEIMPTTLGDLKLLKSPTLLGFKENRLPSFVYVPEKLEDLRVAHGSCRKPHGKGRDGLAALSEVMSPDFLFIERVNSPKVRPHCFFHTGDQIYADDCADSLIEHFTDVGNFLLQRVEQLPYPASPEDHFEKQEGSGKKIVWIEAVTDALPPGRRATNFYTGFTGTQSNHLFSFAEFCAAYLMQWSDVLWPEKLQTIPEILKSKIKENEKTKPYLFQSKVWEREFSPPTDWDKMNRTERLKHLNLNNFKEAWKKKLVIPSDLNEKRREKYIYENIGYGSLLDSWENSEEEIGRVEEFRRDLPLVRRAMANMPNIMTFDDHDITDDWYLTGRWTKRSLGTRLGKTIMSNGLLAFALFQAWGNDPMAWSGNALAMLLQNTLPEDFAADGKEILRRKIQEKLEGIGNDEDGPDEEAASIDENKLIKELESILKNQLTAASLNFMGSDATQRVENIVNLLLTEIVTNIPRSESKKKELLDKIPFFVSGMRAYSAAHQPNTIIEDEKNEAGEFLNKSLQSWVGLRSLGIDANLGFDDLDKPKITWHFSFQMGPVRVFALDTRTRRDFSNGLDFPPNLIRKKALEEQIPGTTLPQGTEAIIVISGAPILGLATIESIGQTIVPRVLEVINIFTSEIFISLREVPHKGEESLDVEHWSLHTEGYEALLKKLAFFDKVICLSGDVHYGITSEMDYWKKEKSKASRFVQMVSSSLKNMKPEGTLVGLLPAAFTQGALTKGLNREMDKLTLFGWEKNSDPIKIRRQFEVGKFRDARPGEYPLRIAYALGKKNVYLPLRDWPLAEFPPTVEGGEPIILPRIVLGANTQEPSYRWRLNIVKDIRTDNQRFRALGNSFEIEPEFDVPLDINDPTYKFSLDQILKRNAFFSRSHFSRAVNWFSNSAIVHFSKDVNNILVAKQSMFFYPIYLHANVDNPGTFEDPYFQQLVSLEQKSVSEQPPFPKEKTPA